jgi:hypothetical protein
MATTPAETSTGANSLAQESQLASRLLEACANNGGSWKEENVSLRQFERVREQLDEAKIRSVESRPCHFDISLLSESSDRPLACLYTSFIA